ncbi:MAG: Cys-tRNA(Pro)/Cys-tRNA(Cys) deacylase YbaK [Syntrophorhabdus sp. PtaU1.Bin153]|nr:MAG: Cys-tRNA(Pro)/Cys-tRNA(Cys) deacylase YbaK [Syntrophorhabdus sp. PtaU1.Bin153]
MGRERKDRLADKDKGPVTAAIRVLRDRRVAFSEHAYTYVDRGGTAEGSRQLGLDEHSLVKTLIMEDELKKPFIVLMHGDREVSTKALARIMGIKRITPCTPATAQKHSGYMVGGTSPFGTRKTMPIYMEETILDLPKIYINGGKRGYLVGIEPKELLRVLNPILVKVAI